MVDNSGKIILTANPYYVHVTNDMKLIANFVEYSNIKDIVSGVVSVSLNPTNSDFTVSFELAVANNVCIVLTDLFGCELVGL